MGGEGATERKSTASHGLPLLHTRALMRRTPANRVFAVVYLCVILALLYHHFIALLHSTSIVSLLILLADAVLAFMWVTSLAFRMCPTERQVFIEHLEHYAKESEYPALDVFICTADPYKEPPIDVVNTALSVMAYDYPIEKLSVYVSDDGGSQLTLFAFMEAARFATHWLPYCKINKIVERCPEAYFASNPSWFPETDRIKLLCSAVPQSSQRLQALGFSCVYFFSLEPIYGQHCLEFMLSGGSIRRWWNDQRVWMMRGLTSMLFGLAEYLLKTIGISTFGFSVTNKTVEEEQSKRYDQGLFEFGVSSPLLLPMTTAAIINCISFLGGIAQVFTQVRLQGILLQMFLAVFAMINCWPIYEAILLRTDEGKMPVKLTLISIIPAWALYLTSSIAF